MIRYRPDPLPVLLVWVTISFASWAVIRQGDPFGLHGLAVFASNAFVVGFGILPLYSLGSALFGRPFRETPLGRLMDAASFDEVCRTTPTLSTFGIAVAGGHTVLFLLYVAAALTCQDAFVRPIAEGLRAADTLPTLCREYVRLP